jgi:hypothetical protein
MDNVTEISFKADADAIRNALEIVKTTPPGGVTPDGQAGYLFVVGKRVDKKEDGTPGPRDGQDVCWVHAQSQGNTQASRGEFPIQEVTGEGVFSYPSVNIDSFKFARGEVWFNTRNDNENSAYTVKWGYGAGAGVEKPAIDPRLFTSMDKRLNEATDHRTYKTAFLKEALKAGKSFMATDTNAKDEYKIVNLYDASSKGGDGTMHSTDGTQKFYFQCDAFKGGGLQIHSDHIALLESFLSKCGPEVVIATGTNMTYAMSPDRTRVVGWGKHTKPPLEYRSLPKSWDKVTLVVREKEKLLAQLLYVKSDLAKGYDKMKVEFSQKEKCIRFRTIPPAGKLTSLPIDVDITDFTLSEEWKCSDGPGFIADVNVDKFHDLFKDVKAELVEFRMFPLEEHNGPKGMAGFRTIDDFTLDSEGKLIGGSGAIPDPANGVFQCKVMRFMPSKQ